MAEPFSCTLLSMKVLLFCEQKYAITILQPVHEAAMRMGCTVLWYVHTPKIGPFPLSQEVEWTSSIEKAYAFMPEAIFVPGNIVPYYLPGVKVQIFHGYAGDKKGHWAIRRYFDLYCTQGPWFTRRFEQLAQKYKDFEVVETGWSRQDWIYANLNRFSSERENLLKKHGKSRLVLYAPTFSPSMTSLPHLKEALVEYVNSKDVLLLVKLHPLTSPEWASEYKELASLHPDIVWIDDHGISKYLLMADLMISDTSSTVYEFLLLNKPVVTFRSISQNIYWENFTEITGLEEACNRALHDPDSVSKRQWIVENFDPHLDGKCSERMLEAAAGYIARKGVPAKRKLNLWRIYTSLKKFPYFGHFSR